METRIPLLSIEEEQLLFGPHDRNVKQVSRRFKVRFSSRGGTLRMQGPDEVVPVLAGRVEELLEQIRNGKEFTPTEIANNLFGRDGNGFDGNGNGNGQNNAHDRNGAQGGLSSVLLSRGSRGGDGLPSARTQTQQVYLDLLAEKELVFSAGPAGTGKTFLAVAAAVRALRDGKVQRLVLTRPAVEAGEHLGFLPGDLEDKVDPYLRPLYDALNDLLSPSAARRMKDLDMIEVAPLAFMRGRTLNDSFVILDEAQNATKGQMKMFLTRLGERTHSVVTGDISQTDLPRGRSGLQDAMRRLRGMESVGMVEFRSEDVQRSSLVQRIVEAYGDDD
ncbi:MAG: PhoH family protein [Planctomycetota bacterium]|nr:PhoH family protein [Planctomycetota bacterium]